MRKWEKMSHVEPYDYVMRSEWLKSHVKSVLLKFSHRGVSKFGRDADLYEIQWLTDDGWKHWTRKGKPYLYTLSSAKNKASLHFGKYNV